MTAARSSRRRTILLNLLLLAVALGIAGLMCEAIVRLALGDRMVLFPRYHVEARYGPTTLRRLRPSTTFRHTSPDGTWTFRTNARGFRDTDEYAHARPAGTLRVLALGDSHTEGFECRQERTWPEVLERSLRRQGRRAQVLNTGISGFGTAEQLAFLEAEGFRYRPDVVVVGLYANDFEDNLKSGLFALDGDRLVVRSRRYAPGVRALAVVHAMPPLRWLSERSYAFSLVLNTVWERAKAARLSAARAELRTEYAVPTREVAPYEERLMLALLARMSDRCRRHGARLVIADIPRRGPGGAALSSIPPGVRAAVRERGDRLVLADEVLAPYRGLAELHVPSGHHHISELTHLLLAMEIAKRVLPDHL